MWSTRQRCRIWGRNVPFFRACLLRQQDPSCDDLRSVCRRTHRVYMKRFLLPSKHFKADKSFHTSLGKYARPNFRFFPARQSPNPYIKLFCSEILRSMLVGRSAEKNRERFTYVKMNYICLPCNSRNSNPFLLLLLNMRNKIPMFSILNERSFFIQNPFGIEALKCSLCSLIFLFCIIALLGLDVRTQAAFWTTIRSLSHQLLFHKERSIMLALEVFCIIATAAHKEDI